MRLFFLLFLSVSIAFSFDEIHNTLKECSKVEDDTQRLNCYDSLALSKKPKSQFHIKGEQLIAKCILCHGKNWDLSTNGERLVKHMTQKQIHESLLDYKHKRLDSTVMNFHMSKFSEEEIELMVKYIIYQINKNQ